MFEGSVLTMKKKIAMTLAVIMTMASTAFAGTLSINNNPIEGADVITRDGVTYIPVRPVAESLGLNVEWDGAEKSVTISNEGPFYLTFKIGENSYTFIKTAPMPLSGASIIVDSKTYVPVDLMSEIFIYDVEKNGENLNINVPMLEDVTSDEAITSEEAVEEEAVEGNGVVTEVSEEEILFEDEVKGLVRLNKSENVEVVDEDGNTVEIDTIEVGANLVVEYGKAMTMSLPPLNNPVKITVLA